MADLRHRVDSLRTVGLKATKTDAEKGPGTKGGSPSIPRVPGGGSKRKDGTVGRYTPEERRVMSRCGKIPEAYKAGPPTAEEIDAFEARYGLFPEDRLHPNELWQQIVRGIGPYDLDLAAEYLDRLANGESIPWMVRNWPAFPGTRTLDSWSHSPEYRDLKAARMARRSEGEMLFAEAAQKRVLHDVWDGKIDKYLAGPLVNAARYMADGARAAAEKHAPKVYAEQLQVSSTVTGAVTHTLDGAGQALLDAVRATRRPALLLEGESEVV